MYAVLVHIVVMMDEDEEEEEDEENDLDCEGELDVETPLWNFYGDEEIDCDDDTDDHEDTALLRASAVNTEIVITPMSPVNCQFSFSTLTNILQYTQMLF